MAYFDNVLSLEPSSPRALANKAKVFFAQRRYNESERLYRKALVSHPRDATAWLNLGVVLLTRGTYIAACQTSRPHPLVTSKQKHFQPPLRCAMPSLGRCRSPRATTFSTDLSGLGLGGWVHGC